MNLTARFSEGKSKLTLCDEGGKCEVYALFDVTADASKKTRRKLSSKERKDIADRYRNIPKTGERVTTIAEDYGITHVSVLRIAKRADTVPIRTIRRILKLSDDDFITSEMIADQENLDLRLVNKIITRYRHSPRA